jgi:hypothetical protein
MRNSHVRTNISQWADRALPAIPVATPPISYYRSTNDSRGSLREPMLARLSWFAPRTGVKSRTNHNEHQPNTCPQPCSWQLRYWGAKPRDPPPSSNPISNPNSAWTWTHCLLCSIAHHPDFHHWANDNCEACSHRAWHLATVDWQPVETGWQRALPRPIA